ncbi:hypothetical protein ACIQFZ_36960 [Streptomyces sp. NPDC093064]|uniref:hypothetical protein n=1 Tax=Streptomyces sp. NPDC093064 TaxID=3366020 RepID=UPI00381C61CC
MNIIRTGMLCALCHTATKELVYLVLSAQSPVPQREMMNDRWCPAGCHLIHRVQWKEGMPPLHSSDA